MIKSLRDAVAKLYDMEGSLEDSINQLRLDTSILNTKVDGLHDQTETNKDKLDNLLTSLSSMKDEVSKLQDTLDSNTLDTKKLHTNHVLKGDTYKDEVDTVILNDQRLVHDEVAMVNTSDGATTYITEAQRQIAGNSLMYYILDDNDKTIVSSLDMNAESQDIDKYMQAYTLQVEYVDNHKGSGIKVSKLYSNSPLRKYHEVTYVQSLLLERYQNEIVTTYGNNNRVSRQLTV